MSETAIRALILVCVFGAVLLLAETLVGYLASRRTEGREINKRLRLISRGTSSADRLTLLRPVSGLREDQLGSLFLPLVRRFNRMITATQLSMSAGRVMAFLLLAPLALFAAICIAMLALGQPLGLGRVMIIATFTALAGGMLPLMVLQMKATRARKRMEEQFPVALDVFVRGLRAGHPVAAALDLLTEEMPDPIGSQFGVVVDEVTYGADLRDALEGLAERWDLEDMRMFVISLSVQSETGGNLAEILENLSRVIRERASLLLKVRALSSEGRMTAIMLTALPILAFTSLFLLNPPFYLEVADDPAFVPGFTGLILLYIIGFVSIRKMVNLKV